MSGAGLRPIPFDEAAAEEAAHQLVVTAESLIQCLTVLNADYPIVTEDWNGHFRDAFDNEIYDLKSGASMLFGVFLQLAALIRARAWEAAAAQAAYERQPEET